MIPTMFWFCRNCIISEGNAKNVHLSRTCARWNTERHRLRHWNSGKGNSEDIMLNSCHAWFSVLAAPDLACGPLPLRHLQSIRARQSDGRSASTLRLLLPFRHHRQHKSAAMNNWYRVAGTAPNLTSSGLSA